MIARRDEHADQLVTRIGPDPAATMSLDYSFMTSSKQMGRMRQLLKRAGYDDEVVDTVIARNSGQEVSAGAYVHQHTLAKPSRGTPAPSIEDFLHEQAAFRGL